MARLAGVDIPNDKRIEIALTYIFGVGRTRAKETLEATGTCVVKSTLTFVVRFRSTATRACVTVRDSQCADSAPRPTRVPARDRSVRSLERRRPPSNR